MRALRATVPNRWAMAPLGRVVIGAVRRWGLAACLLLAAAACASQSAGRLPPGTAEPDKFLFEKGQEALAKRRWLVAREYFRQVVDSYTQSPYRPDAKLAIGDTYLGEDSSESLVLAINEYKEFLSFYPTNARADYAQLKLGMAYAQQMRGPQRDQSETKEAIREFETFLERYPNSSLLPEARAKLREARDRLSESEYLVGLYYYRAHWYPGAIDRLQSVLKNDPEFTKRDAVYFYLAEALVKAQRPAEALPYFERLVSEFDQSEHLQEANRRIVELKNLSAPGNEKSNPTP